MVGYEFPIEIRTDRLRLRRLTREEVSPLELYRYCRAGAEAIDEVTEHVPWGPHRTPNESREFLARTEKMWDEGRRGVRHPTPGQRWRHRYR
ncbi:hypothetical protein [Halogeometricum limi]|uniref:hypothetical protein n=1 Tax=Halogeometricum limi TaxID=555875 RepID=UPI001FDFE9FC|nr:hypothetical protein [Halogeometricum limi]